MMRILGKAKIINCTITTGDYSNLIDKEVDVVIKNLNGSEFWIVLYNNEVHAICDADIEEI